MFVANFETNLILATTSIFHYIKYIGKITCVPVHELFFFVNKKNEIEIFSMPKASSGSRRLLRLYYCVSNISVKQRTNIRAGVEAGERIIQNAVDQSTKR